MTTSVTPLHCRNSLAEQLEAVKAFALQIRYPVDWPTPVLPDEQLAMLGEFYQQERLWERGVRFLCFCHAPQMFGFHRPVEHAVNPPTFMRLHKKQRRIAACVAAQ